MAQVAHIDAMTGYAGEGQEERETVDQSEQRLDSDNGVDEAREDFPCENGVLFYQFREVIKSARCGLRVSLLTG